MPCVLCPAEPVKAPPQAYDFADDDQPWRPDAGQGFPVKFHDAVLEVSGHEGNRLRITHLRRHPEKRFQDLDATRRAYEEFALVPTSVMNFVEGTRFTAGKHLAQRAPYRYLLKPKAGALAQALNVLGDRFRWFLDVTIVYPRGAPSFWQFLCGGVPDIVVRIRRLPIPPGLRTGDYASDKRFRKTVEHWLQDLCHEKDRQFGMLLELSRRQDG